MPANEHRHANSAHAVYEPHGDAGQASGLKNGPMNIAGVDVIAIHDNPDGSFTGVTEDGTTVHLPVEPI